jgi:hypothetical protein
MYDAGLPTENAMPLAETSWQKIFVSIKGQWNLTPTGVRMSTNGVLSDHVSRPDDACTLLTSLRTMKEILKCARVSHIGSRKPRSGGLMETPL